VLIPKKLFVSNRRNLVRISDLSGSGLLILNELNGEYLAKHANFFYLIIFRLFAGIFLAAGIALGDGFWLVVNCG